MLAPAVRAGLPELDNLLNDTSFDAESVARDPLLSRIQQIMEDRKRGIDTGIADLAALVRHVLLSHVSDDRRPSVTIRTLPSQTPWETFGLKASELGRATLLEPTPWRPAWLAPRLPIDGDAFAEIFEGREIRHQVPTPIDPSIREVTGYTGYACPGQRESVRSLLHMPAGSTLVVNLPTGSGKTLVGQLPPLLDDRIGLTLFVVPTTALALDQTRRMEELIARKRNGREAIQFAWHADLPQPTKAAIKQRIRNGSQGILFASPEAVRGALLPSLYDASASGLIRYLVVDEAHIVCEWGDGFRPDFQALAGVRSGLMRHSRGEKMRTILMSATLTGETLGVLETLYGSPGPFQMVAAVNLRPEPRYLSTRTASVSEKVARVRDLVRHVPRPFLLYVTEPRDAEMWLRILRSDGYKRIDAFHGGTPPSRRGEIISAWATDRLDGIVATSAFGVGMDKADIRAVIHAIVPETLDRYYQEVGRGGRDGQASVSVTVYAAEDVPKARGLGRPRFVGDDNAFERWRTMYMRSRRFSEEEALFEVDLTSVPPRLHQESDYNRAWNVRTLILMARSGLIALDSSPRQLPERASGESEAAYEFRIEDAWSDYYDSIIVRILDDAHLNRQHFEETTARDRDRAINAAERSFENLMAGLEGRQEMGDLLTDLYTVNEPGRAVVVSRTCRGCPAEPDENRLPYNVPPGHAIRIIEDVDLADWSARFPRLKRAVSVLYSREAADLDAKLERALAALVGTFGIAEVAAPEQAW
jgi:ATP-dependent DNA helicase RecQ